MPSPVAIALFYSAIFIGSGANVPFMPVWFRSEGLSGAAIAVIVAAPAMARTLTGPLIAVWADRFRLRRTPLALLAAGSAVAYAAMLAAHGFLAWLALWFVAATLFGALSPLADVIAIRRARIDGFAYGAPRGVGSAAYALGNVGMGAALTSLAPVWVVRWSVLAASAAAAAAMFCLPPDPVADGGARTPARERFQGLGALFKEPVFMLAVVSNGLIQASHAYYYAFSALAWRRQGLGAAWTGGLWGTAIVAEVLFLWLMEPWRRRVGPGALVVFGGVAAAVRWSALAAAPGLAWLVLLQALHALTYTATFLGGLGLIERHIAERNASAAQTLNSSVANGVMMGLATLASGWLFDRIGARGYAVMAVMAAAGGLLALPLTRAGPNRTGAKAA